MSLRRLSLIDSGFLEIESATAPMHIGFAVTFSPPEGVDRPTFEEVRDHISARLAASPRYRQKIVDAPLGGWEPLWVDDPDFDFGRHLMRASSANLTEVVDSLMSVPLEKDRPLWQMSIVEELEDGRLGVVGKAHHCMVDGLAALELASLLLDTSARTEPTEPDSWVPAPCPSRRALRRQAVEERITGIASSTREIVNLLRSPSAARSAASWASRMARALVDFLRPAPRTALNQPNSPLRHLARTSHPLDHLLEIKKRHGTTLNDVVLAATAGALRRFMERRGQATPRLKAVVPVDLRISDDVSDLGNELSFMWIDLPVDEPDPLRRLRSIHRVTSERKVADSAEAMSAVLALVARLPQAVKKGVAHLFASPRTGNLIVSNLIGPPEALYLLGCEIEEIYPMIPLTGRHGVSIGLITVKGRAYFSIYADRESVPEGDLLADDLDAAIAELRELDPERDPAG